VMPGSGAKLLDQLAVPAGKRSFADVATPIAAGTKLPAPAAVFPRYQPPAASAAAT
jgi:methionyl-tRNA synthetase